MIISMHDQTTVAYVIALLYWEPGCLQFNTENQPLSVRENSEPK